MTRFIALLAAAVVLTFASEPLYGQSQPGTTKAKPDRGAKQTGSVLVFSGTGWYRHPETAAINGWLARLADDTGMRIDVTENPKDVRLLNRYRVLILPAALTMHLRACERSPNKCRRSRARSGGRPSICGPPKAKRPGQCRPTTPSATSLPTAAPARCRPR